MQTHETASSLCLKTPQSVIQLTEKQQLNLWSFSFNTGCLTDFSSSLHYITLELFICDLSTRLLNHYYTRCSNQQIWFLVYFQSSRISVPVESAMFLNQQIRISKLFQLTFSRQRCHTDPGWLSDVFYWKQISNTRTVHCHKQQTNSQTLSENYRRLCKSRISSSTGHPEKI